MRLLAYRSLAFIFLALGMPLTGMVADLGSDPYCLPLVDRYAIYRSSADPNIAADRGRFQLVEVMPSTSGLSFATLVPRVESVAVENRVIFGKSADGFFILDARYSDRPPQIVDTLSHLEMELRWYGIADAGMLTSPDALAAGVPEQTLRPWKYRAMGGLIGFSDDAWSLLVQLLGFVIAFAMGFTWPSRKSLMVNAAVLGFGVNIVANIFIAGGGPGAFAGFVAMPLLCLFGVLLGKGLRSVTFTGRSVET